MPGPRATGSQEGHLAETGLPGRTSARSAQDTLSVSGEVLHGDTPGSTGCQGAAAGRRSRVKTQSYVSSSQDRRSRLGYSPQHRPREDEGGHQSLPSHQTVAHHTTRSNQSQRMLVT